MKEKNNQPPSKDPRRKASKYLMIDCGWIARRSQIPRVIHGVPNNFHKRNRRFRKITVIINILP